MHFNPYRYQQDALNFLARRPCSALLADPGTGKTAIILALIKWLRREQPDNRVLVLSSLRVITEVWPGEVAKWDQFSGLKYKILHGKRKIDEALDDADFYLMNLEGLPWASSVGLLSSFQTLVIDESSLVKSWSSDRVKLLRRHLRHFSRRHIMTGSPTPLSLLDYFSQQYIVDMGATLGRFITHFQGRYFYDAAPPRAKFEKWRPFPGALRSILGQIQPYAYRLDGEQLLELPELVENDLVVELSPERRREYTRILKTAESAGEAFTMARQLAGGFLPDRTAFHAAKFDRLERLVDELAGEPLVVYFTYRREGEALAERFDCPLVYGGTPPAAASSVFAQWNAGELPVVALSPAVCGHGLNLQDGGHHICWYSLPTNADHYFQANRRLRRQGQRSGTVFAHRLIASGTVDPTLVEMLEGKTEAQRRFLDGLNSHNTI